LKTADFCVCSLYVRPCLLLKVILSLLALITKP